jgi:hypothetical protein
VDHRDSDITVEHEVRHEHYGPYDRRITDAITRHELHAETRYATKTELSAVSAALHAQGLDVVKLQLELEGIRKSLDQISSNLNRVVWIVLTAVILGGMALVVRPGLPL